ncbi:MAG: maturation protein [Sanya fiers-like virus 30]|nr:MAG: maturation protein [Sanya fiers-like virus 30]
MPYLRDLSDIPRRYYKTITYEKSPRVNGKLVLRANPVTVTEEICTYWASGSSTWQPYSDAFLTNSTYVADQAAADAYARAFAKFQGKCNLESQLMLAVDFAERQKTIDMVGTTFGRILRATRAIKAGQLKKASTLLGMNSKGVGKFGAALATRTSALVGGKPVNPANLWLEYRYGWSPLMGTIYGLCEKLSDLPRPQFIRERGSKLFTDTVTETVMKQTVVGRATVTISGQVVAVNSTVVSLRDYGVINPAAIAWELIPFSFVVDWFIGVGDYLNNYTALSGLTFANLSKTTTRSGTRIERFRSNWGTIDGQYYGAKFFGVDARSGSVASQNNFKLKKRVVLTSLPVPEIQWGKGLNKKRTVDTIALLVGTLSSLRRK